MSIERNEPINFHAQGTLDAVTRWIATHPEGIAEWFKNVRRQYQVDRANVAEEHRTAVLLLKDARGGTKGIVCPPLTVTRRWRLPAKRRPRLRSCS